MFKYSKNSTDNLKSCDPNIQLVFFKAIKYMDISILKGARDEQEQTNAYTSGRSKLAWPESKHNVVSSNIYSLAVDAGPYNKQIRGIDWRADKELYRAIDDGNVYEAKCIVENIKRWKAFIGLILGIAAAYNVPLYNGSDWDKDYEFNDQSFIDSPHFEIRRINK